VDGPLHPDRPAYQGQTFNGGGYAFNSGHVAMQENFLWNVCCVTEAGGNWNLGRLPSYNGKVTAPINADTFRITKGSKHPTRRSSRSSTSSSGRPTRSC
jgi:hypothetical protein